MSERDTIDIEMSEAMHSDSGLLAEEFHSEAINIQQQWLDWECGGGDLHLSHHRQQFQYAKHIR